MLDSFGGVDDLADVAGKGMFETTFLQGVPELIFTGLPLLLYYSNESGSSGFTKLRLYVTSIQGSPDRKYE